MDCEDVNECEDDATICGGDEAGFCFNSAGEYECVCNSGFHLVNKTCVDVNECVTETCGGSGQQCVNTFGSFTCGCAAGFIEQVTLVNFQPISECIWPEWSEWSDWTNNCNVDLGTGIRQRACSVRQKTDGCPGADTETRECGKP